VTAKKRGKGGPGLMLYRGRIEGTLFRRQVALGKLKGKNRLRLKRAGFGPILKKCTKRGNDSFIKGVTFGATNRPQKDSTKPEGVKVIRREGPRALHGGTYWERDTHCITCRDRKVQKNKTLKNPESSAQIKKQQKKTASFKKQNRQGEHGL